MAPPFSSSNYSNQVMLEPKFTLTDFHSFGNLSFWGAIISLVPTSATGITFAFGKDAASLAIPVLPGSKKGFLVFFDLVPSGKIPKAEFDARTSDAIALAVRFNCPVFTFEFILSSAGIILDEESESLDFEGEANVEDKISSMVDEKSTDLTKKSTHDLELLLKEAIQKEDYERASLIRDEINKRQAN